MTELAGVGAAPPRRGLVLGGGGVLGAAWMVGALCALEQVEGFDPRDADVIVGTSAGAVLAALLGAGVSAGQLRDHQQGLPLTDSPLAGLGWDHDAAAGPARPAWPRPGIGSPALLARTARRLHRVPATTALAALVPTGRGTLTEIRRLVDAFTPGGAWSPHPGVRVVALDYETGQRVVFGAPSAPRAGLADAVTASCAIPGWYAPVVIGGRRYIDGGAWSATSVDVLGGEPLDEVYVLAPTVSFALDAPTHPLARLERRWRVRVTRRCLREVDRVAAHGTVVTVLGPGPADLRAMGGNLMASARRARVLETSLRTSVAALRSTDPAGLRAAL